ncbi:MAG: replication-associated recombination protein A [Christensenellaceae bacterium]|jgi:putative ATPase|nr:replication-associated recombination protein A [Christensenellaceae bacterium]
MNAYGEPLASKIRPKTLDEFVGQEQIVGENAILRKLIDSDNLPSLIFWGPAGVGKTTLAKIIARTTKANFITFSAVKTGIKEVKEVMAQAEQNSLFKRKTVVFVDEIHRFNKSQQDAFLPYVESGAITLIGATTENPSFEVVGALLSRCRVFILKALTAENILVLLRRGIKRYEEDEKIKVKIAEDLLLKIAEFSNGDGRMAINILEMVLGSGVIKNSKLTVDEEIIEQITNRKIALFDKNGEEHFNIISAIHKSMRNSDPQAAVYWLARMLDGGEDPLYIARRLVRFASEDVGLADSNALLIANACFDACHKLGMPECGVHLAHAVVYLSLAPKSNAVYVAYNEAMDDCRKMPNLPVPMNIRNAPTKLMKKTGYGAGYQYAHDLKNKVADMQCLPDNLKSRKYYRPTNSGKEPQFAEVMKTLDALKNKKTK